MGSNLSTELVKPDAEISNTTMMKDDGSSIVDGSSPVVQIAEDDDMIPVYVENDTSAEGVMVDDSIVVEDGTSSSHRWIKRALGLLLLAFVAFVICDSLKNQNVGGTVNDFLEWVEENPTSGVIAFILVYFAATVLFIPGSLLTLGAGFVFGMAFSVKAGVVLGTFAVFVGGTLGAFVSFLLGRYLLRESAMRLSHKYAIFEALDKAMSEKGFRIFFLLRLSPVIPFNAVNYMGGVTAVSLRDYMLAMVGLLPGTVLYVFLGAGAGSLTSSSMDEEEDMHDKSVTFIILAVGAVFGILSIYLTTRYARAELAHVLEARSEHSQETMSIDGETLDEETPKSSEGGEEER